MPTTKRKDRRAGSREGRTPRGAVKTASMATRFDEATVERLDNLAAELERRHGLRVARATAIRLMVERGLDCTCAPEKGR